MPKIEPRTKAPKGEQLNEALQGELATYEKIGLLQRSVGKKTAYRYRGTLLQYQKVLNGATPTLETSAQFLGHLRVVQELLGHSNVSTTQIYTQLTKSAFSGMTVCAVPQIDELKLVDRGL